MQRVRQLELPPELFGECSEKLVSVWRVRAANVSAASNRGRARMRLLIFSTKILSLGMPWASSASSWDCSSCARVEQRAYATRMSVVGPAGSTAVVTTSRGRQGRPGSRSAGVATRRCLARRRTLVKRPVW